VLRSEKQMGGVSCDPVGERNDEIIPVLLVHGGKHLGKLLVYGRLIT
jgi:hypothetical protein